MPELASPAKTETVLLLLAYLAFSIEDSAFMSEAFMPYTDICADDIDMPPGLSIMAKMRYPASVRVLDLLGPNVAGFWL